MTNSKNFYSKFHILILLFSFVTSYSQTKNDSLIDILKKADKILLTSHKDLLEFTYRKPNKKEKSFKSFPRKGKVRGKKKLTTKYIPDNIGHDIMVNNKPNKKIIIEKAILNQDTRKELLEIISDQTTNVDYEVGASCFEPHHTIFIYKNKKWLYIDLCFGCRQYNFSEALIIKKTELLVSNEDWDKLEGFFRKLNLSYKLPKKRN